MIFSKLIVIILDFIVIQKKTRNETKNIIDIPKNYIINSYLTDHLTNETFKLMGSINMPNLSHFTATINDILWNNEILDGWWMHDGMKNMGSCILDTKFSDIIKYNPYVLYYIRENKKYKYFIKIKNIENMNGKKFLKNKFLKPKLKYKHKILYIF